MHHEERTEFAVDVCRSAGRTALSFFRDRENLTVDQKGAQDWVSDADRDVELLIRSRISERWPQDGICGEEHGMTTGDNGFDWVIDPIDGTTNFVNGIPNWTVVLAGVADGETKLGVIHDPITDETFVARKGGGAVLNDASIQVAANRPLSNGTVAVGYSNRVTARNVLPIIEALIEEGAMFHRNGSGALSLAYVAAGRLLGYVEEHMNAWDCLAGQLLISEAGGVVEQQNADDMIRQGGRVIAGSPDVFDRLKAISISVWDR